MSLKRITAYLHYLMNSGLIQFTGELNKIAEELVLFLIEIGQKLDRNENLTKIVSYLQVFWPLSQENLQKFTNLAISTISSSLSALVESNIVKKDFAPNSSCFLYKPQNHKISFEYYSLQDIIPKMEFLDKYIKKNLTQIHLDDSIPNNQKNFFSLRLNSLLNYIELQLRTLASHNEVPFLEEITQFSIANQEFIEYCPNLLQIETQIIQFFVEQNIFSETNAIKNRLIGYFITRGCLTQENITFLSGYSLSTVSRYLTEFEQSSVISAFPKEYRKPKLYYLQSFGVMISQIILSIDRFIFSYEAKFQSLLKTIQSQGSEQYNFEEFNTIVNKLQSFIHSIQDLKVTSARYESYYNDYITYLKLP